jgi:hypothetical protein
MLETLLKQGYRESYLVLGKIYIGRIRENVYDFAKKKYKLTKEQATAKGLKLLTFAATKGDVEAQRALINFYQYTENPNIYSAEQTIYWAEKASPQSIYSEFHSNGIFNAKMDAYFVLADGEGLVTESLRYFSRESFKELTHVSLAAQNLFDALSKEPAPKDPVNLDDSSIYEREKYLIVDLISSYFKGLTTRERVEVVSKIADKLYNITKNTITHKAYSSCWDYNNGTFLVTARLLRALKIDKGFHHQELNKKLEECGFLN